jgi:GTP-binding protein HflX
MSIGHQSHETATPRERAVVVGVEWRGSRWEVRDSLDELSQLAETAGAEVVGVFTQKLATPNPATFVGKGKLDEIRLARTTLDYDAVLFDDELSPGQQAACRKKPWT